MLSIIIAITIYSIRWKAQNDDTISWAKNIVWYQIIPDRRANWNTKNDATSRPIERSNFSWTYSGVSLQEARSKVWISPRNQDRFVLTDLEKALREQFITQDNTTNWLGTAMILRQRRFGGDFQWIEDHIKYLEKIGVWWIILQPIWLSTDAMRYEVQDRRHIDPRLTNEFDNTKITFEKYIWSSYGQNRSFTESDKEFFKLIEQLHNAGIKVLLDMSLLYGSANNYLIEDIARNGKNSEYYKRFDVSDKPNTWWYHKSCNLWRFYDINKYPLAKDINYEWRWWFCSKMYINQNNWINNWLYKYYNKIFKRRLWQQNIDWITYEWADWIRLDAYLEYNKDFLKWIKKSISEINPNAIVMWEERSPDTSNITDKNLDTMSFYPMRTWAEALLIESWKWLVEGINSLTNKIQDRFQTKNIDKTILMSYLDSHDTDRILSRTIFTNRELTTKDFSSSWTIALRYYWHKARDSAWLSSASADAAYIHSKPAQKDIDLFKSIVAFQFLLPGSPVIYYGDEMGMFGADDPDNRQPMWRNVLNQFPRHVCKRDKDPKNYCTTSSKIEDYSWDTSILDRYTELAKLKNTSEAIRNGDVDMNICYGFNNQTPLCTNDEGRPPLIWFHRIKWNDHVIYLHTIQENYIDYNLRIDTHEKNADWLDLEDGTILHSDNDGLITIGQQLKNTWYLVLLKQ